MHMFNCCPSIYVFYVFHWTQIKWSSPKKHNGTVPCVYVVCYIILNVYVWWLICELLTACSMVTSYLSRTANCSWMRGIWASLLARSPWIVSKSFRLSPSSTRVWGGWLSLHTHKHAETYDRDTGTLTWMNIQTLYACPQTPNYSTRSSTTFCTICVSVVSV